MLLAISGTPGTGKTEVAEALAKLKRWRVIHLNDLAQKKGLYIGFDRKRDCKIVDLESLREEVKKLHEDLIVESHYAHEFDADIIIILRCHPKELRKRLESRRWSKKKIDENVESEIMEICRQDSWEAGKKALEVDTTGREPKEVAEEILKRLHQS
ncbi:MAG: adenylate kinase family protein [Candidatus Aenigmatarchaeota archaeon]